jgi:hypothetical protein
MPNSAKWERKALESWVRWRIRIRRTRCSIMMLYCSIVFTPTKRMVGLVTASQDRLRICRAVLAALDMGLHVSRPSLGKTTY